MPLASLHWLIKKRFRKDGIFINKQRVYNNTSSGKGVAGILLSLIKAYRVINDPLYKQIVEVNLRALPQRLILLDFSLESGLAGLGELFLEAAIAFANPEWQERADWIAQVLLATFHHIGPDSGYWFVDANNNLTADLGTGNSGVLHFLIRYQSSDRIGHPLCPNYY